MTQKYNLLLQDGEQIVTVIGSEGGKHNLIFSPGTNPDDGTIEVEYSLVGHDNFVSLGVQPIIDTATFEVYGAVKRYRITIADLDGGAGLAMYDTVMDPIGFVEGAFEGLRALTVQGYVEANVKRGLQYEASFEALAVTAAANVDLIFTTTSKPVIIKGRFIEFDGEFMEANVYANPDFTGGTPLAVYNLNNISPVASTVTLLSAPTVTGPGTQAGATTYGIGTTSQGQSIAGTYMQEGNERLLSPNTSYLLRITNTDDAAQDIACYITWYEGETDF